MKTVISPVSLLFSFLLLAAFFCGCTPEKKELPLLRIGQAPHDHHASLFIAAMNGDYFREHGGIWLKENVFQRDYELMENNLPLAKVVIDASTGGRELVRRLAEEQHDMTLGGVPAMLAFIDQGSPIRIVAPIMTDGAGLVLRADMNVTGWDEFVTAVRSSEKPVKIGYKMNVSVQNLIFEQALRQEGLQFAKDVADSGVQLILVNLYGEKNMMPALESGLVDGIVINQPFLAMAEEKGVGKVAALLGDMPPAGKWQGIPCCALAAADSYVEAYPEVAAAMVALMLRANRFIHDFPEKSATQIAQWLAVDPGVEMKSIPTIHYLEGYDKNWDQGIALWVDTLTRGGMLKGKVKEAAERGEADELIHNRAIFDKAQEKK